MAVQFVSVVVLLAAAAETALFRASHLISTAGQVFLSSNAICSSKTPS